MSEAENRGKWWIIISALLVVAGFLTIMFTVGPWKFDSRVDGARLRSGPDISFSEKVSLTGAEWRERLTTEQYYVLREHGTEAPGSGKYNHHTASGLYVCAGCDAPLFDSEHKYDSKSGWPSFTWPADGSTVAERDDESWFYVRTEVYCVRCDGHLGHVFDDGPQPTGLRYCINSAALRFKPRD